MSLYDQASSTEGAVIQDSGPLRVYFAHPITHYNPQFEGAVIADIWKWMGAETDVINPSDRQYQEDYLALSANYETRAKAFDYFLDLARTCNLCVFAPFDDGRVGSGVGAEIQTFFARFGREARVYEWLPLERIFRMRHADYFEVSGRVLDYNDTRRRIDEWLTKDYEARRNRTT